MGLIVRAVDRLECSSVYLRVTGSGSNGPLRSGDFCIVDVETSVAGVLDCIAPGIGVTCGAALTVEHSSVDVPVPLDIDTARRTDELAIVDGCCRAFPGAYRGSIRLHMSGERTVHHSQDTVVPYGAVSHGSGVRGIDFSRSVPTVDDCECSVVHDWS